MNEEERIVVGLDIGTTKICVVVARQSEDEGIKIVGIGKTPSKGLKQGVVINIDDTVKSIMRAVEEAKRMSGVEIDNVYVGIAGAHIRSHNSKGVIAVASSDHEITENDVRRVIDAAKAVAIPLDQEIIHVIPQEFIVDEQKGIKDPIGMAGVRLEAEAHIVTGAITSAQNIYRCIEKAGLGVQDLVLEPLASSLAVLSEDEKELGVALIDIGGGTSDIAVFHGNSIRYTSVVGLGGNSITNDLAFGLSAPTDEAEEIKKQFGCAIEDPDEDLEEEIEVRGVGDRRIRTVTKRVLNKMIQPRIEEILVLVRHELNKSEYHDLLGAGIVLTGGGALLRNAAILAEQIFDKPARIGVPRGFGGLTNPAADPLFSTGIGLCMYGLEMGEQAPMTMGSDDKNFKQIYTKMKEWIKEFF